MASGNGRSVGPKLSFQAPFFVSFFGRAKNEKRELRKRANKKGVFLTDTL
jgi:hypothetical protein